MRNRLIEVLRSLAAVLGGYLTVAFGTILTFNVVVGQVTTDSAAPIVPNMSWNGLGF